MMAVLTLIFIMVVSVWLELLPAVSLPGSFSLKFFCSSLRSCCHCWTPPKRPSKHPWNFGTSPWLSLITHCCFQELRLLGQGISIHSLPHSSSHINLFSSSFFTWLSPSPQQWVWLSLWLPSSGTPTTSASYTSICSDMTNSTTWLCLRSNSSLF